MVEKRGEIAVRGGILDVFPPTADHPVRVEFFGDEITDIRTFGVTDQRSLAAVDVLHARRRAGRSCSPRRCAPGPPRCPRKNNPTLGEMLDNLANGISVEGMESLIPVLVGERAGTAADLVPAAPTSCSPTRNGSAPARPTWSAPATSSSGASWMAAATGGRRPDRPRLRRLPEPGRGARCTPGRRAADLAHARARSIADGQGRRTWRPAVHEVESYRGDTDRRARRDLRGTRRRRRRGAGGRRSRHRRSARRAAREADMRPVVERADRRRRSRTSSPSPAAAWRTASCSATAGSACSPRPT